MKYYETKIGQIIEKEFDSRMELAVFTYILSNGIDNLRIVTDDDIANVKGDNFMTAEFCQALVRCAVEICKQCENMEIIKYIRLHLHCLPSVNELIIYRDNFSEVAFNEILDTMDLENEQVGDYFTVYAIVNEDTLKEV